MMNIALKSLTTIIISLFIFLSFGNFCLLSANELDPSADIDLESMIDDTRQDAENMVAKALNDELKNVNDSLADAIKQIEEMNSELKEESLEDAIKSLEDIINSIRAIPDDISVKK
jgi:Skp family chaperone for outer membrane proteins